MNKPRTKPKLGRPRAFEQYQSFHVLLPAALNAYAILLGDGNRSAGIRKALELAKQADEQKST